MNYSLTGEDISNIFDNKIKIVTYDQLSKFRTVEELLSPYGKVALLYVWENRPYAYGHWVCLFVNCKGNIEFFDSFGTFPDDTLDTINKNFRMNNGEDYRYLTHLLYNYKGDVEYNDKVLQGKKSSTCGRWISYRMIRNDLTIEDFQKLFTKNKVKNDKIILSQFNI